MTLLPIAAPFYGDEWFDATAGSEAHPARHIDDAAIAAVTHLHREILPAGGAILDLMSGWVSHLPPEIHYRRVVGVGLNACELAENPFLDEWRVQDLNRNPHVHIRHGGIRWCGDLRVDPTFDEALRGHPGSRARAEAGGAARRDLLELLPADACYRLLASSGRCRSSLSDRSLFCRSGQLDRHPLPGSDPTGRRRPTLCGDRTQPRPGASDRPD